MRVHTKTVNAIGLCENATSFANTSIVAYAESSVTSARIHAHATANHPYERVQRQRVTTL